MAVFGAALALELGSGDVAVGGAPVSQSGQWRGGCWGGPGCGDADFLHDTLGWGGAMAGLAVGYMAKCYVGTYLLEPVQHRTTLPGILGRRFGVAAA